VGVYIAKFSKILVKFSVFGDLSPIVAPMRMKFGMEEFLHANISTHNSSMLNFTTISLMCHPGAKCLKIAL